jgi:hypothetical protein
MTIATLLKTICETFRQQTGASVTLGPPDNNSAGIFVWPIKLDENSAAATPGNREALLPLDIRFMVIVHPPFSEQGLSMLERAYRLIQESIVLRSNTGQASLACEAVSLDELSALFRSVNLPVMPCICVKATIINSESSSGPPLVNG